MVSIIVPVYNVEEYLNACVESALKLTVDAEILLVDDGSTDGSGALCDAWAQKDNRVRVIHQENGGLSAARNTGIRNAKGEYLLFLDSDDLLNAAETERLLVQLGEHTDVALGIYENYYEDRLERENCEALLTVLGDRPTEEMLAAVPADGSSCYMVAVRFLCRRSFLLEHDLLFLPGIYHEDEEWTQRLLCRAPRVLVTDCAFYYYRQARAGSITANVKAKHLYDSLRIIREAQALEVAFPQRAAYLRHRMGMLYLNAMIHVQSMGDETAALLQQLRQQRGCAGYMTGRIGTPARLCTAILGVGATTHLLALARKLTK